MITLVKQNCVVNKNNLEYEKYPAQMLEVAGDLRRAPAEFENPESKLSHLMTSLVQGLGKRKLHFLPTLGG